MRRTGELQWIQRTVLPVIPLNYYESTSSNHSFHRRKFIFAFQYFEQIGHGTQNLLELCSLAKYGERYVVAPYVHNSRMTGIPFNHNPLQSYFDLDQVNKKLKSNGYSTLTSFKDMAENCNRRFDVVVLFLFHVKGISMHATALSYQISERKLKYINWRATQNHGWTNCKFIQNLNATKQLIGFSAGRYVCVDPAIIRTREKFEEEVLRDANCVGIVQWRGIGSWRSQFVLPNTSVLRPSDLKHNARLVDFSRMFVEKSGLGKSFISVHVRAERHLRYFGGVTITRVCFHQLAETVQKLKIKNNWNVYLSSDLLNDGSDTLKHNVDYAERQGLYLELNKALGYPVTLGHIPGVHDKGAKAIIEMHILATGKILITLGGGKFQQWIIELFSPDARNQLYRICPLDL